MEKKLTCEKGRYERNGYYNYDICRECKGQGCCAHFGCMYSPMDFIVLRTKNYTHEQRLEVLVELLRQGKISIDMCWMKDTIYGPLNPMTKRPDIDKISNGDGLLYLRARNKGQPIVDLQFFLTEKHYPCTNWNSETGCELSEEERPFIGRMTNPVVYKVSTGSHEELHYRCETNGEDGVLNLWKEHQLLLYDLYLNVRDLT